MKKLLPSILAAAMLFVLAACDEDYEQHPLPDTDVPFVSHIVFNEQGNLQNFIADTFDGSFFEDYYLVALAFTQGTGGPFGFYVESVTYRGCIIMASVPQPYPPGDYPTVITYWAVVVEFSNSFAPNGFTVMLRLSDGELRGLTDVDMKIFNHPLPKIGDIIEFGGIDWRVLDVDGVYALVVSEYILERRQFHHTGLDELWSSFSVSCMWETSDIRYFLNNEFYHAFTEADRARIRETSVATNQRVFHHGIPTKTTDKIFLLSVQEVVRYFGDSGMFWDISTSIDEWGTDDFLAEYGWWWFSQIFHDQYSEARIGLDTSGVATSWWLRTSGASHQSKVSVWSDGIIGMRGSFVGNYFSGEGIRPAMWINIQS